MDKARSEATKRGLEEARKFGRILGRKPKVSDAEIRAVMHLGTAQGARMVGLTKPQYIARRRRIQERENNNG